MLTTGSGDMQGHSRENCAKGIVLSHTAAARGRWEMDSLSGRSSRGKSWGDRARSQRDEELLSSGPILSCARLSTA